MNVFISYRRDDTKDVAGRLADRLRQTRGISKVFVDVEEIAAGDNFLAAIKKALNASSVSFVLIGTRWAALQDNAGTPRILDPDDVVALEVQSALAGAGKTIPVLVNGASMPRETEIPPQLAPLLLLNASPLSHERFEADLEGLLAAAFGRKIKRSGSDWAARRPILGAIARGVTGLMASFAVGLFVLVMNSQFGFLALPLGGSHEAATFVVILWVSIGSLAPAFLGGRKARR